MVLRVARFARIAGRTLPVLMSLLFAGGRPATPLCPSPRSETVAPGRWLPLAASGWNRKRR